MDACTAAVLVALAACFTAFFLLRRYSFCRSGRGKVVCPIEEILERPERIRVNLHRLQAPALKGRALKVLNHLYYTVFGKLVIAASVKTKSNLDLFDGIYLPEKPTLYPSPPAPARSKSDFHGNYETLLALIEQSVTGEHCMETSHQEFRFNAVAQFFMAYKSGHYTPLDIAQAVIAAIVESNRADPPLRAIIHFDPQSIMAMARESAERWKNGSPLSFLDGVPVSIKEDFRNEWYAFHIGTTFVPKFASTLPMSNAVRKLRSAGAVIIGVTNMPEFGCSSIGSNANSLHQQPRNPYNVGFFPGGSSSGAGTSVASGLCPVAVAGDGGGSGRVPAAVCGVISLKPTNGLLQESGSFGSLFSFSTLSPISSSVLDVAIVMDVLCNFDEDQVSQRPLGLRKLETASLTGLTVGVYWDWFEVADSKIVAVCKQAVCRMQSLGATVKEIKIPELEEIRVAHVITAVTELAAALSADVDSHFSDTGPEALLTVATGLQFSSLEYVNVMKQRTRALIAARAVFKTVDVIVTPTTGCCIPQITPDYFPNGKVDAERIGALEVFTYYANFIGAPAITVPVGYIEDNGLPIGLQIIAPWYQEQLLLEVAWAMDSNFSLQKPQVWFDVMK